MTTTPITEPTPDVPLTSSPPPPAPSVGRVETDMFCDACLYNLHGLEVTRDQRLNLPIVRCPECGKFHAAGIATGAGRLWLDRLARFLIATWVLFLVAIGIAAAGAFAILDAIEVEAFVSRRWTGHSYLLLPADYSDFGSAGAYYFARILLSGTALLVAWFFGTCFPVFLAHVRQRAWFLLVLILPPAAGFILFQFILIDYGTRIGDTGWYFLFRAVLFQVMLQSLGILLGIALGRPATRLLLRALLTRKLLQYLRFLWEADGKTPPALDPPVNPSPSRKP